MDLFLSNTQFFTSQDVNWRTGGIHVDYCDVLSAFVMQFLQICSDEVTNSSTSIISLKCMKTQVETAVKFCRIFYQNYNNYSFLNIFSMPLLFIFLFNALTFRHVLVWLKGIVHFEIKIWYLSAYPKGIQDVGVFFSSVDPILMFLGQTVLVCQSYNGRYRSLSLWEGKRTCTEKFKLNNSPS